MTRLSGEAAPLDEFRTALATLPVTFGASVDGAATIAAVDGRAAGWWEAARSALSGADAAIVHLPTADAALGDMTEEDGRIVLAQPWSGSPAGRSVPSIDDEIRLITADFELLDGDDRSLADAAADLLTVALRPVVLGPAAGAVAMDTWRESGGALIATGTAGSAALHLTGVRSRAAGSEARVAWRSVAATTRTTLPGLVAARPGTVARTTAEGENRWETGYLDYRRASLQEAALVAAGGRCRDMSAFRRAAAVVAGGRGDFPR